MKAKITILALLSVVLTLQSCVENDETGEIETTVEPQQLPSAIAGNSDFKFPEKSDVILGWLADENSTEITKHAWGVWQGLTSESDQVYDESPLLVYQTWLGISDLKKACANGDEGGGCEIILPGRAKLDHPTQLTHSFGADTGQKVDVDPGFFVSVSYDPNAACYATSNLILNQSSITKKASSSGGIGKIDPFPNNSVTIKPTYYLGKTSDKYIRLPAWKGPPTNLEQQYKPSEWKSYVYADVSNSQKPGKIAIPTSVDSKNPPESAIVNLNEFIHYALDEDAATYMNEQQGAGSVVAGDLAILVAMHVATKEISNWTWQTFFWTTDPANPDFPSSGWEASLKPKNLNGAAGHYAVSTAYAMVWPNQPVSGGTNEGVIPHIGYNPYLEAGLPPGSFQTPNKLDPSYKYGLQSNCMSCHALATSNNIGMSLAYSADQYVDMKDPMFKGMVQLDFAWSIQRNLNENK